MTKDLFKKAKDKVKDQKLIEQQANEEAKAKKDHENQVLNEIQERNKLLIAQQKLKGEHGPSLKEREQLKKQEKARHEKELERQLVKERRIKRINEDKSSKGLDQINKNKLRQFHENKLKIQTEEEMLKRQKEVENIARQKLRN